MKETARLYLRERTRRSIEEVLEQPAEEQLEFFGYASVSQFDHELSNMRNRLANKNIGFVIRDLVLKDTGKVSGSCGFHSWLARHERAELGYLTIFGKFFFLTHYDHRGAT